MKILFLFIVIAAYSSYFLCKVLEIYSKIRRYPKKVLLFKRTLLTFLCILFATLILDAFTGKFFIIIFLFSIINETIIFFIILNEGLKKMPNVKGMYKKGGAYRKPIKKNSLKITN